MHPGNRLIHLDPTAVSDTLAAAGLTTSGCPLLPFGGGIDNHVFLVHGTGGRELIVKVPAPGRRPRYAVAAWAAAQLAAVGIPAPKPVWHADHILVETRCPGRPLIATTNRGVAARFAYEAGQLLRQVHDVPVTGYGRLSPDGTAEHPRIETWLLRPPTPAEPVSGTLRNLMEKVTAVLRTYAPLVADAPSRLLHGDWTARHVLHTRTQITGVVDLESVRGGDPVADVAGWSLQEPAYLTEALASGYFAAPPDEHRLTVMVVHRLRIALFLLAFHTRCGEDYLVKLRAQQIINDLDDLANGRPRLVPRLLAPAPPLPDHSRRSSR
ncbi:phosphotransferase family protein [Streptomyces fulvoviolaceus]|uniref:phosphotransferase family protein n=1 Tax=Streptomyces fulvoviolaceus TaxID=285535 RepID=UPI0021C00FA3|nr:aminoglycoside phosphotransferase family protein [Streptomyces fulvoviolaceus]MCT9080445.1 aminoglycoside phosphotransferase family protein [Streptomyces fulvoviolaceus]